MDYPYMLIMRNSPDGMIWQAYTVKNDQESSILTKNAQTNGFIVQKEELEYTDETSPGWREIQEWKDCISGKLSGRAKGQEEVRQVLKDIRRDGPYWLGGYNDWLVACFSLRGLEDLHGFTPLACWSEQIPECCVQYLACVKNNELYIDVLRGTDRNRSYGIKPELAINQTFPSHIFDWIKKIAKLNKLRF